MKKLFFLTVIVAVFAFTSSSVLAAKPSDKGFNEFGYNDQARVFVGLADGVDRNLNGTVWGDPTYTNDKLVMKWNSEWDRGNDENWANLDGNGYDAWENNEWNGAVPGGSGEVWHYKIKWVGAELVNSPRWVEGGYPIWGQFEVIMDQGTADGEHLWFTHGIPSGYNAH